MGRLIHNGKVSGAEMWCLDHDRKVLEQAGTANTVVVRKEEPHMVRYAVCCLLSGGGLAEVFGGGGGWAGKGNVKRRGGGSGKRRGSEGEMGSMLEQKGA